MRDTVSVAVPFDSGPFAVRYLLTLLPTTAFRSRAGTKWPSVSWTWRANCPVLPDWPAASWPSTKVEGGFDVEGRTLLQLGCIRDVGSVLEAWHGAPGCQRICIIWAGPERCPQRIRRSIWLRIRSMKTDKLERFFIVDRTNQKSGSM
jgi:hypothetical protein